MIYRLRNYSFFLPGSILGLRPTEQGLHLASDQMMLGRPAERRRRDASVLGH